MLDSREEREWVRDHLTDHVVGNICNISQLSPALSILTIIPPNLSDPYEIVSFFVGGRVESGAVWVWSGGQEVEEEADRCHNDHHVGDCLAITWDQERGCRSLSLSVRAFLLIMKCFIGSV